MTTRIITQGIKFSFMRADPSIIGYSLSIAGLLSRASRASREMKVSAIDLR